MLKSLSQKNITQIQGQAKAEAKRINAEAVANATNMTISATSDAYKELDDMLGINAKGDLDKFIYYSDLQTADNVGFLYNIKDAIVKLNK